MSIQDPQAQLDALKKQITDATQEKARAETTLEHTEKQRADELEKLKEYDVDEDALPGEIERLEALVKEKLEAARGCLGEGDAA